MDAAVLGDGLPEVTQKSFLDPGGLSLFAVPAWRELESGCRGSPGGGGVSSSLRPKPSASICSVLNKRCDLKLQFLAIPLRFDKAWNKNLPLSPQALPTGTKKISVNYLFAAILDRIISGKHSSEFI